MPQQTRSRSGSSRPQSRSRSGSSSPQSRRTGSKRSTSTASRSRNGSGTTGSTASDLAKKVKVPAIAAGAGLVGLAGGAALGRKSAGSQKVGKKLGEMAKSVGGLSEGVGSFAAEIRRVREGLAAADSDGPSRSPIEVVLQGLTSRRRSGES